MHLGRTGEAYFLGEEVDGAGAGDNSSMYCSAVAISFHVLLCCAIGASSVFDLLMWHDGLLASCSGGLRHDVASGLQLRR